MPRSRGLRRGDAHRGDLGVGVGDARHAVVVDRPTGRPASCSATRMPSAKPTCASCEGPGIRSPTAEIVGDVGPAVLVHLDEAAVDRRRPSPRSPRPAETGPRPTATSRSSASSVLPLSSVTLTPESVCLTPSNGAPSSNSMPRRRNARSAAWSSPRPPAAPGAAAPRRSSPRRRTTSRRCANSTPITPPPRTTTDAGTRSSSQRVSLVITRSPSIVQAGQRPRLGAGGQHDVLGPRSGVADGDRRRRGQPALALDDVDLAACIRPCRPF